MSLIITRGFGDDIIIEYITVSVCAPEMNAHESGKKRMTAHEWGKKSMKVEPCMVVVPCEE